MALIGGPVLRATAALQVELVLLEVLVDLVVADDELGDVYTGSSV